MKKLIVILGPTASGKTDYAIELAQKKKGAVVSADSRQVYIGMDIGTAKVQEKKGIRHYLLDIKEPNDPLTLSQWQKLAYEAIDTILDENKQPYLVGGTMLYIDSIRKNYELPNISPNQNLRTHLEKKTTETLYSELLQKDPDTKTFIEPHNRRRIIRALEVIAASGKPFSAQRKSNPPRYEIETIGLFPGWDALKERITTRAKQMLEEGLLEETQKLRDHYGKDLPLLSTMNYKQAAAILDATMTKSEALEKMIRVNMKYARRQMSWWKKEKDIRWISFPSPYEGEG